MIFFLFLNKIIIYSSLKIIIINLSSKFIIYSKKGTKCKASI